MPHSWPIRRYLLALVLAIAAPLAILWTYSLQSRIRHDVEEAGLFTLSLAQMTASDAQRLVRDSGHLLAGLARRPKVAALDPSNCDGILADFRNFLPQFANVAITDAEGRVVCSALPQSPGKLASVAGAVWLKQVSHANRYIAGHPHIGPISGKWVSVLAYPIQNASGQFIGAVGLPVDLVGYQLLPSNAALPDGTVLSIIEPDGTIVATSDSPEKHVGRPYPDAEVVSRVTQKKQGEMWLARGSEAKVYGFAPVAGTDWSVVSSVPFPPVFEQIVTHAAGIGGALLLLISLTGLLLYYLGRRIVTPVLNIASAAKAVAAGDLNIRAEVSGPREIADVACQFNGMLDVRLHTEQKYRNLLESATDAIVIVDARCRIIFANAQAEAMFGFTNEELIRQPIEMLMPVESRHAHAALSALYVEQAGVGRLQKTPARALVAKRKDGTSFPVEVSLSPLMTDEGLIVSSVIRDVSERKHYEEHLLRLAQYDALTGLPNRHRIVLHLEDAIEKAEREQLKVALILLDVVRFKEVNDTLGRRVGDQLLKAVSERLSGKLPETCLLGRPASDEFLVMEMLPDYAQIVTLVEKIHNAFVEPLRVDNEELFLSLCAGIAVYPHDGRDHETLLKSVDVAMHHSKRHDRQTVFYSADMLAHAAERIKLENRLRRALPNAELLLHYQPQVDIRSGTIVGVEALVRWYSPELGTVPPDRFIPIAEETGLIDSFGEWILQTACAQNKAWQEMGLAPLVMAVNISARQFRQKNLAQLVRSALSASGLEPQWLELEITESMLMDRPEEAVQILHQITDMGVRVALDDFGTGYSSLAYLKRFPVRGLKIDRSFVRDIHKDPDDAAIVTAVVSLAKSLDLQLVAEGVELKEQLDFLRSLECDSFQGYYFSKPIPSAECTSLLERASVDTAD